MRCTKRLTAHHLGLSHVFTCGGETCTTNPLTSAQLCETGTELHQTVADALVVYRATNGVKKRKALGSDDNPLSVVKYVKTIIFPIYLSLAGGNTLQPSFVSAFPLGDSLKVRG